MNSSRIVSLFGLIIFMAIAWLVSSGRRRVNWRVILWGTAFQLVLGALVFLAPGSRRVFLALNDLVLKLLSASEAGQEFVFGVLGTGKSPVGFILMFQALPAIVFFSALMSLFYYWRMMPWLIRGFARVFTRLMGVSGAESLCTAANIFVGIESLAAIRPYLARMTRSELCTILTGGLATVASSMLAVYVLFLKDVFPTIAGHLISASILSAPASLIMSKLIYPESGTPETLGLDIRMSKSDDAGSVDAVINGAMAGMKLVMGVVALLMAFLSLLALAIWCWAAWGAGPAPTCRCAGCWGGCSCPWPGAWACPRQIAGPLAACLACGWSQQKSRPTRNWLALWHPAPWPACALQRSQPTRSAALRMWRPWPFSWAE